MFPASQSGSGDSGVLRLFMVRAVAVCRGATGRRGRRRGRGEGTCWARRGGRGSGGVLGSACGRGRGGGRALGLELGVGWGVLRRGVGICGEVQGGEQTGSGDLRGVGWRWDLEDG